MRNLLSFACIFATSSAFAEPVINEIFYRPPGPVEPVAEEWIEIRNPDLAAVDVSGWRLSKGVTFTIPAATTIPAGGYLVVAANVAAFNAAHPGFTGTVLGGWVGTLANGGEQVQLDNALGAKVCDVSYADEGEWALRGRGVLSFSHKGWDWYCGADGDGYSFELRNPVLGIGSGQNWGVSAAPGGSPGAANSVASANIAPLIKDVKHKPEIPKSTEAVTVSANLEDEAPGAVATLHWRLDAGTWASLPMTDTDGDGDVEATIAAQANLAVVEWYVSATDGTNTRTWPAPARTSDPGVLPETFGQVVNALYQVDDSFDANADFRIAGNQPLYRFVMTAAERNELVQIGTTSGQEESAAEMNGTFISHDGTGVKSRYLVGFRNRGQGSALGPPNNYHVSLRSDDKWNGRGSLAINCRYGYLQALGNALVQRAGLATQEAAVVRVRVNGVDLAETGNRMYSRYVRLEGRGGEWAEAHYPNDAEGNFYRLDDHNPGIVGTPVGNLGSGEFRYEGNDPAAYSDTFVKETNKEANDYSDLIDFCKIVSAPVSGGSVDQPAIPDAAYPAAVAAVLDLDNFYRYLATDTLIGNREGGMYSGRGDDASMYRGLIDTRFRFIHHDLDTTFDGGDTSGAVNGNIFTYDITGGGVAGLTRLFNHPQLVPRYYAALIDAMNTWFNNSTIDPIIDHMFAGWVPAVDATPGATPNRSINDIKAYIAARRTNVLSQIPQTYSQTVTVGGTTTAEGYQRTNDGSATFSGNFNVARVYSITVNGTLVPLTTANYRASAGTWSLAVPAGGGTVLHPGLNRVTTQFWDAPNGTGNAVQSYTVNLLWQPLTATYTNVSGALVAGSLRLTAPASYIPGKPFVVRADVLDGAGNVDRSVWDSTVTLSTATAGVTLPSIQLYNGTGSALVTAGGGSGGGTTILIEPGGTSAAPNANAPDWRMLYTATADPAATWKSDIAFNDASWVLNKLQGGAGDGDERTNFTAANVDTAQTTRRAFYFRKTFNVTDPSGFSQLLIKAVVDDGAVFYLNGQEVYRDNMPAGAQAWNTPASSNRSGTAETQIRTFDISAFKSLLVAGNNLLAVQVHNYYLASPVTNSADLSFDCELDGVAPAADPGNFTLNGSATVGSNTLASSKSLTSLTSTPTMTNVSGTLAAGTTNWSGVINVTGNTTVPAGSTLNIAAGTHILIAGDATAGSAAGSVITVNGSLNSNGTFAQPVNITAANAGDKFGGFLFSGAQPSVMSYTFISRAGHTTGVGHTSRGPAIRLTGSSLNFDDSVVADISGKIIYTSGTLDLNIRRSLMERAITGPELEDGAALLIEDSNIQRILPDYRESNSNVPDDEDCLYVHNGSGRPVVVRRSVFARCGDDVFDCLGGPITVEDSILREGWDKGMSLLNNDLTISRTQIIRCDKAIVPKSQNADTRTVNANFVTIVSENHDTTLAPWGYSIPPASPDPDSPSTGFYTQNKSGQSNAGATLAITAKNCIVIAQSPVLVDAPYSSANTVLTYCDTANVDFSTFTWPGTGNISADPLFANAVAGNFRITASSPCRDSGDPATTDPDSTRGDMGALYFGGGAAAGGTVTWTAAGGPYRVTANATVPVGTTLNIGAGTAVYFDKGARMTVNGRILAQGTPTNRITMSHVPGTVDTGDCDPIKNGTQTGPAKWGGLRIIDSLSQENIVQCVDFINAQGTSPIDTLETDQENWGSLGSIRSWVWVDNCTWTGSHLRWCYGRCAKLTVTRCNFGDMFDATEAPPADFISGSDNKQEPLKVEYKTTDSALTGNANFANGFPIGGWFRVYYNDFHGNKGHNDVFDGDGGRAGINFVLDCRYNYFHGLTGDEHIDLKGDALIANNVMENGTKDQYTSDTGYSNVVSGDGYSVGTSLDTTIMFARNLVFDMDHVVNCKSRVGTIVEHNTVGRLNADFHYSAGPPYNIEQDVFCAVVNLIVLNDSGGSPQRGDGCYLGNNIFANLPRLINGADTTQSGGTIAHGVTSKIEFNNNICWNITDTSIGFNHAGTIYASAYGSNLQLNPQFVNPAAKNFALKSESPARRSGPADMDLGWSCPEWAYIKGGPIGTSAATAANFEIGGPGLIAFKWRIDGVAWSAPVTIGTGAVFDRTNPTIRTASIALTGLTAGTHTLEVLGQDFAGNWQDADPAKSYLGLPQFAPTARTWTVDPAAISVRINEVLADSVTLADQVELHNFGASPVTLSGWSLTDDVLVPAKYPLPLTTIPAGGFATFSSALLGLDSDGDSVYLYQGATLRDSVTFGPQIPDLTIGRTGQDGAWELCSPTPGAANTRTATADQSGIRINEWFSDGIARYNNDWVELSNSQAYPVNVAGLRITDNRAGEPAAYTMPPLSFIPANGFLKLVADGVGVGSHLAFALDAQQDDVTIFDSSGVFLDTVQFFIQSTDYSQGRDATGAYVQYELPTAGLANNTTDANALALLRGLRVTEIMYNALGGSDFDYVELTNTGATALQLQNVRFVSGITFSFTAPTTLNAGESVMVVKNLTKFRSRYGNAPVVAGTYTGNLDNGGEGVAIQLPPPFEANILTFDYADNWYTSTDGGGTALTTVAAASTAAQLWRDKDTWTTTALGGSPMGSSARTDTFSGWMTLNGVNAVGDDNDKDGILALVECALGMNPNNPSGGHGAAGAPAVGGSGSSYTFLVPENAAAAQGHGVADLVYTVQGRSDLISGTWSTVATKSFGTNWTGTVMVGAPSGGFVPVTVSDTTGGPQRFFRLQITWAP